MEDEKLAFEAMMNEIGDSDSDEEFEFSMKHTQQPAESKHSEHEYHSASSKGDAHSMHDVKREGHAEGSRGNSPPARKSRRTNEPAMSKDQHEIDIDNFGANYNRSAAAKEVTSANQHTDFVANKNWLMRACHPHDPTTQCYVIREKNLVGGLTLRLYMEPVNDVGARFIMSAKKFVNKRTSYYLISVLNEPEERGGDDIVGKVRANGVGSKYLITDHGLAPDKTQAPSTLRKEHGLLKFKFDPDSPSSMQVYVPIVNKNGVAVTWQPRSEEESIEECVEKKDTKRLNLLVNKKPKWDAAQKGHVLNFEGRVTQSSVKNFQLTVEGSEEVCLQFGRVGKDKFTMDVRYPLSLFQAFGLCIAGMDKKIADRQGYSFVQKLMGH